MRFQAGDRVRLASQYRVWAGRDLASSDQANHIPIGATGTVTGYEKPGFGADVALVIWDHPGFQGRPLRAWEGCLEFEITEEEIEEALQSIAQAVATQQEEDR